MKHFTKATVLDAGFAQAWVGLGQAYASLEEVEPALAAYRTAMRLLPNAHVPPLAMATLSMKTGQLALAKQYLDLATARCASDPLVYHEAGVLEFRQGAFAQAWGLFNFALSLIADTPPYLRRVWEPTMFNMGHVCRKLG